jgi:hypothetical protein
MVAKCANPPCSARFRYLGEGRLFRMEIKSGKNEYFWLCSDCTSKMTLKAERGKNVIVVRRSTAKPPESPQTPDEQGNCGP